MATQKFFGENVETLSASQGERRLQNKVSQGAMVITGGTIDNAVIGGSTAVAGTFSTLAGTTIDGIIGSVTPAAGAFTDLSGKFKALNLISFESATVYFEGNAIFN